MIDEVSPDEALGLATGEGGAILLDVREDGEVAAGAAPGSTHMALATLAERIGDLPKDRRIVCVCRSGQRSARATQFLGQRGFDAVNLGGGMRAWAEAGLAVEKPDGSPGEVI